MSERILYDRRPSRVGAQHCGICRHWDEGECMVLSRLLLPTWIKRRVEWMQPDDGQECDAFKPGKFGRLPNRSRRRRT
jgi:hypothetical protein